MSKVPFGDGALFMSKEALSLRQRSILLPTLLIDWILKVARES
jgi:hypothetical protein